MSVEDVSKRVTVEGVNCGPQAIAMVREQDMRTSVTSCNREQSSPCGTERQRGASDKHGGLVTERDVLTTARSQPARRLSERASMRSVAIGCCPP